ncbi:outer membrane beta-barrel protein [Rhodoflexus sp.]
MTKKFFLCLLLAVWTIAAKAQLDFLKGAPINLVVDLGISNLRDAPEEMALNTLNSRSINIYYMKSFRISNRFSFNSGLGGGMEKYGFSNEVTLIASASGTEVIDISQTNVRRSLLAVNYIDLPAELRFASSSGRRAFRVAVGGKVGVRISSHTKIRYEEGTGKFKDDFNLNPLRYGVYGRIGYSSYNVFAYYGLSELFRSGRAPQGAAIVPFMFGISLTTF